MGFKLLLADDSITIQKVVSIIFANEEYALTIVDNGDAALEKAAEIIPDIMLVDTLMPGTGGYDVCRKIRQDASLRNVPVLLLTGAFEPFDVDKARESGADDFISKPFESQVLIEKVKSLVQLGQGRATAPAVEPLSAPAPTPTPESSPEKDVWSFDVTSESLSTDATSALSDVAGTLQNESVWGASEFITEEASELPVDDVSFVAEETPLESPVPAVESPFVLPEEPFAAEEAVSSTVVDVFETPGDSVEVSPEDDLWGAFELEPVEEGQEEPVDILETDALEPGDLGQNEFVEGPATGFDDVGTATSAEPSPVGAVWGDVDEADSLLPVEEAPVFLAQEEFTPVAESSFGAVDFEPVVEAPAADREAPAEPASEGFFFAAPAEATPFVSFDAPPEEPAIVSAPPEAPAAVPAVDGGSFSGLTEEQLAAVISRISREVIEKVVWEVVPDLAEMLIKEEIRKIKEGR